MCHFLFLSLSATASTMLRLNIADFLCVAEKEQSSVNVARDSSWMYANVGLVWRQIHSRQVSLRSVTAYLHQNRRLSNVVLTRKKMFFLSRRFLGGHSTFFGLLNTFVHIVMYSYYLFSALGPQFQKYLWWKKYLTTLQMVSKNVRKITFLVYAIRSDILALVVQQSRTHFLVRICPSPIAIAVVLCSAWNTTQATANLSTLSTMSDQGDDNDRL